MNTLKKGKENPLSSISQNSINNLQKRKITDKFFKNLFLGSILFCLIFLIVLLSGVIISVVGRLTYTFLTSFPSRRVMRAGFLPAIVGSLWLIAVTAFMTIPVGIGSALYLEEYANKKSNIYNFLEINISNLAGIPSIVY